MSFETATLDSLCELVVDCPHSTPKWTDEGIIVLRNQNIKNGVLDLSAPSFTNEEDYQKRIKRAAPKAGDIVFTREAPMGEVCMIPEGLKCCLGQRQVLLRPKSDVNGQYLFWALQSPYVQQQIAWNEGTGSTVSNVRIPVLKALNIPRIGNEDMVAKSLSDIASKMALNTQTNQTLEQMAQAIFKSWFVDFDPVKAKMNGELPEGMDAATASLFPEKLVESEIGLIPEGWVETPLYDIAEYINGAAYKKFEPNNEGIGLPIVKIAELKAGITQKTGFSTVDMPAKYRLEDNDILFSWSGNPDTSIDTFVWALGEAWLNQHIFKVVPKSVLSRDYVLCLLKFMRPVFAEIARDKQTTGLGHVTVKDLKRLTVALPSEELLIKFNEKVSAIIAQNFSLVKQNQNLEKLRDTLLPKLLSGEIELANTEDMAEVS